MSNAEPIVLTWPSAEEPSVSTTQEIVSLLPTLPATPTPAADPPSYTAASRPTTDVKYTFSPVGSNSMVLLPPADSPDTRPQYFITTAVNVFMPFSVITTLYRGANEFGERVGEFEMGLMNLPSRIVNNKEETRLDAIFKKEQGGRTDGIWSWKYSTSTNQKMRWDYSRSVAKCLLNNEILATYKHGPVGHMTMKVRSVYSEVTVTPKGQKHFDQIVLSLLVVERKRLTPGAGDLKALWNV